MTTNRSLRFARKPQTPVSEFWQLGNLTDTDPEIPNLPLEASAAAAVPFKPYASHVSTDIIVSSWTVKARPIVNRNRQIVDNTPVVNDPPRREPYSLSFIPSLWQSEVRLQAQRKLPQGSAIAADKPKPNAVDTIIASWSGSAIPVVNRNRQIVDNPPIVDQPHPSPVNTIIASWFFTFAMPPRARLAVLSSPPIPKSNLTTEIIARAWAPVPLPQRQRKLSLSSPPIPKSTAISGIIAGAWAPFVLPQAAKKIAAALADAITVDFPPGDSKRFQINLIPTTWAVDYFDPRIRKSIAVFTPNIPPVVIPGTPAGGIRPYNEIATLGWGAIRAYPQIIFDLAYETPPRGVPEPVATPVLASLPASEDEKLRRYAEAAAAFDLDLVMKYLEAMGIELDL